MRDRTITRLGPAAEDENIVFGACRPGYPSREVSNDTVDDWINQLSIAGIRRVCCLLQDDQLFFYDNLIGRYKTSFGSDNVLNVPMRDRKIADRHLVWDVTMPFLKDSELKRMPVVAHCSGGSGRTGQVLVAWLIGSRGYSFSRAINTTRGFGRNPCEAYEEFGDGDESLLKIAMTPLAQGKR